MLVTDFQPRRGSAGNDTPPALLLMAVWFALFTGLGEVAGLAAAKFVLGRYLHLTPSVVWMAPVSDLAMFGGAALVLWLLARPWPRLVSFRWAAFAFALLASLSLALMVSKLHGWAALLLALGLAAQSSHFIAAHPVAFRSLVRRTTLPMAAIVLVLAVGVHGWPLLAERRALAAAPPAAPDAPNLLLIVLDTVRARNLSLYGYPRPTTPRLEQLAGGGAVFARAFSPSPWTLPSHASMFTGRYPHELSTDWASPLDRAYPTLAEILSARGYATAAFVANLIYTTYESGLGRGFARYEDYPVSPGRILMGSSLARATTGRLVPQIFPVVRYQFLGRKTAARVNEDFLSWLSREGRRPFFVFLNYFDAHEPYLPPAPFDTMFGPPLPGRNPRLAPTRSWSPPEVQAEGDAYDGSIAYLDHHLGLLLERLRAAEALRNTLVIVTSDHGEEFYEHGLMGHGHSLYLPALHVPLLVWFPARVPQGRVIPDPVSLRDLPATVVDLLGLRNAPFPGRSLARYWAGRDGDGGLTAEPVLAEVNFAPNLPRWLPVSRGDMKSLVRGRDHYIRNGDAREELYDIEGDPLEQQDRAGARDGHALLAELRGHLERLLRRADLSLARPTGGSAPGPP